MANWTIAVTTTSQVLIPTATKIGTFIATNTGTTPIYIRYSQSWPAVVGEGICLNTTWSSIALQQPTNDAVSVIAASGTPTLSYYYQ